MVKKVTLSLLALLFLLRIVWYVVPNICHSPRFIYIYIYIITSLSIYLSLQCVYIYIYICIQSYLSAGEDLLCETLTIEDAMVKAAELNIN